MKITLQDAQKAIMQAIDQNPDKIVTTCSYVWHGQPECIVGVALDMLGVPLPVEQEGDELNRTRITGDHMAEFLSENGIVLTDEAINVLQEAQDWQDRKFSWDAVREQLIDEGLL